MSPVDDVQGEKQVQDEHSAHGLMRTTRWPRPDLVLVELRGDLDLATAPALTTYLRELTRNRVDHLVLDMRSVTFLASSGLTTLVTALAEAPHPDRVHLLGVAGNRVVRRILALTQVGDRFVEHDDLDALLRELDAGR